MPALKNTRHERFACALAEGKGVTEAYAEAGYSENRGNASRMNADESIRARVAELQAGAAEKTEMTLADLVQRLVGIADAAESLKEAPGLSVARAALMDVAKLNGWLVERTDNRNTNYDVSDKPPMTEEEWEKQFATEH